MSDSATPQFELWGVVDLDADGMITRVDATFARWVGAAPADLVGATAAKVLPTQLNDTIDQLGPERLVAVLATPGAAFPAAIRIECVESGRAKSLAVTDVSDLQDEIERLRQSEQSAERGSERLQVLFASSVAFAKVLSLEEVGPLLAETARRSFRASGSSVHLFDGDEFVLVAGESPLAQFWPEDAPSPGTRTVAGGRVVQITSTAEADLLLPGIGLAYERAGVHAVIAAPIMDQSDPIGVVACYFTHPRQFDDQAEPLARALAQQAAQAIIRIRLSDQLRRNAMRDMLTGLPSRQLFAEQLERALARRSDLAAVLFIDLDGFKVVNDRFGHGAGDELLAQVGDRLRSVFRDDDAVARWGGDEFIAVFEVPDRESAIELAERAREVLAEPFDEPLGSRVTASIGLVLSSVEDGHPVERLIRLADQAMYSAKSAGGNRVAIYLDDDGRVSDSGDRSAGEIR